jgi:hypothetical protein
MARDGLLKGGDLWYRSLKHYIGRWVIFGVLGCQIEVYQHRRGLRYGSMVCTGGSASFSGEKGPNLDEIMGNNETTAWEWAETHVLGKRGVTR